MAIVIVTLITVLAIIIMGFGVGVGVGADDRFRVAAGLVGFGIRVPVRGSVLLVLPGVENGVPFALSPLAPREVSRFAIGSFLVVFGRFVRLGVVGVAAPI